MYEKMIAVTNRHLIRESNENEEINAGTDWSEAYLKTTCIYYFPSSKSHGVAGKGSDRRKIRRTGKGSYQIMRKGGDDPYFASFSRSSEAFRI